MKTWKDDNLLKESSANKMVANALDSMFCSPDAYAVKADNGKYIKSCNAISKLLIALDTKDYNTVYEMKSKDDIYTDNLDEAVTGFYVATNRGGVIYDLHNTFKDSKIVKLKIKYTAEYEVEN